MGAVCGAPTAGAADAERAPNADAPTADAADAPGQMGEMSGRSDVIRPIVTSTHARSPPPAAADAASSRDRGQRRASSALASATLPCSRMDAVPLSDRSATSAQASASDASAAAVPMAPSPLAPPSTHPASCVGAAAAAARDASALSSHISAMAPDARARADACASTKIDTALGPAAWPSASCSARSDA